MWAKNSTFSLVHTDRYSRAYPEADNHCPGDAEPIITKRISSHEKLVQEMNEIGIDCEALSCGSHQPRREETYYSHGFALSRLVTNKGSIKVSRKNIDFVQMLQRN